MEDALIYSEPPGWYLSARVALGGLLLRGNDYAQAEVAFHEDLKRHPQNGRSLFGLYRCLKAQGKDADAAEVYKQYQIAWKKADTMLGMVEL